jgi:hypothetical protein
MTARGHCGQPATVSASRYLFRDKCLHRALGEGVPTRPNDPKPWQSSCCRSTVTHLIPILKFGHKILQERRALDGTQELSFVYPPNPPFVRDAAGVRDSQSNAQSQKRSQDEGSRSHYCPIFRPPPSSLRSHPADSRPFARVARTVRARRCVSARGSRNLRVRTVPLERAAAVTGTK